MRSFFLVFDLFVGFDRLVIFEIQGLNFEGETLIKAC